MIFVHIGRGDCLGQYSPGLDCVEVGYFSCIDVGLGDPGHCEFITPIVESLMHEFPNWVGIDHCCGSAEHSYQPRCLAIQSSIQNLSLVFTHGTSRRLFLTISAAVLVQNAVIHVYLVMETCGRDQPYLN